MLHVLTEVDGFQRFKTVETLGAAFRAVADVAIAEQVVCADYEVLVRDDVRLGAFWSYDELMGTYSIS